MTRINAWLLLVIFLSCGSILLHLAFTMFVGSNAKEFAFPNIQYAFLLYPYLMVAMLISCFKKSDSDMQFFWLFIIIVVHPVGTMLYYFIEYTSRFKKI